MDYEERIEQTIIEERNREILQLSNDLQYLSEIYSDLSLMIDIQGEDIDHMFEEIKIIEKNVEIGTVSLEEASFSYRKILQNIGIIGGSLSLGALGFIGGPLIGSVTLLSSVITGTGIIFIKNKLSK